jgi:hypothetical protein
MGLDLIPGALHAKYTFAERDHACAILKVDFPEQFQDILDCLAAFVLRRSYIAIPGGSRSPVSKVIDGFLSGMQSVEQQEARRGRRSPPVAPIGPPDGRGWRPRTFQIRTEIDGNAIPIPTHEIDNFKIIDGHTHGVGVEVEWNNKDPFYDRDLTNFRLLRSLGVLSVGVIITRLTELQQVFNDLGRGSSYGNSTTHWEKLIPRLNNGTSGGCPVLAIGMGVANYDPNS